ncbi:metal-nicotianamine transporter YSL3 isoform X1 [Citrus sinensis]|uniref:metal-nicotianamine transporter YSL3 isoform X1 n=1 Tax=Citrus sinensis TaxID=2711 RepID=UPI0022794744|nr:metal-nicotianamine transporter YSL3 isoform X1 [Citrus sinensis]XP_052294660.1 metal-nicotianamine transporter YSL3 isoform X1 [Citrus sinensis]XP_052294661.1 metal-nicotianamine transporter YSL3 isoform X1 [Citrus sinensis]XP_052294662.1 metal-nicotianamine transporter YSL3 isoform X1 [Citrus sinensis]XP_052294663.1 metal-nicotianamine transporter YSL3 isoform X1 [Citrus sinensis]XP_052294664.1 metal-nicotianamine transporter YSL3 isoform X1 [Citrus sinensis]XP_052294665.1 metal-nicotian
MESRYGEEELKEIENVNHHVKEELDLEEIKDQTEDVKRIPPWTNHITIRGLIASVAIGIIYSVIVMKLNLTTGLVPNLNVSAALLAFVFVRTWTKLLHKAGITATPFTRQENTVIQTCAVACYSIAVGGGFGSYLLGLNRRTYQQSGVDTPGNNPDSTKEPEIGWMIGFLFVTSFVGLLALVPLRKIMIIDYKLSYPSGTATAVLINGFHTPKGDKRAKKQVHGFTKFFSLSFLWAFFQWFYAGGEHCGFVQFPTFGLKAWKNSFVLNIFYFDFSMTYIGAGMICSHLVNLSLLLGAVLSWGIMWPLITGLKGDWFPKTLPESSMKSLNGYKVFVSIALILGDGLYNFLRILYFTATNIHARAKKSNLKTDSDNQDQALDNRQRNEIFIKESIPMWTACVGYTVFSIISIIVIPLMFPKLKWYYVVVAYILAPSLSFCNAYGAGLTDMNMAYNYGKVALFVLAALSGKENGVVAGLVGCGLIKSIVSISSDLMHDFKTGHLTLTSPRSMLVSQAIGTAIGCVVAPLTFFLFYKAFDVGNPDGEYKAPYAIVYRNMAILGVEGFSALPQHCLQLCYGFFAFAIAANLLRDLSPKKIAKWIPLPMAMAVPFLVGAYFAIDMCLGSLVVFAWHKLNSKNADLMIPAVASGLICGDGLWILPSSILALANVRPPICMKFLAS